MPLIIKIRKRDVLDPKDSKERDIRLEPPGPCEEGTCALPRSERDPAELVELATDLAEYLNISFDEAFRRLWIVTPSENWEPFETGVDPKYHAHLVITGREPETSPRYFACTGIPPR